MTTGKGVVMTNLACTRHGFPLVIIPSGNSAVDNITMGTNLLLYSNHQVIEQIIQQPLLEHSGIPALT